MKAYLEPDEVKMMEDSSTNLRDRLLIRLLFRLGCRVSEALALRVKDVDLASGAVTIEHLKARLNISCPNCQTRLGRKHTFCPGCGQRLEGVTTKKQLERKFRTLPLDSETVDMLGNYIRRGGPVVRGGERVIFGINRHRAWQVVRDCAERVGLPKLVDTETGKVHNVSPHRLRTAFAVNAMKVDDSGDGLRLLQEHLGHANFGTTAKYRKVSGTEHRDWYQGLWGDRNGA
jgi:integrase/recombinase XerD